MRRTIVSLSALALFLATEDLTAQQGAMRVSVPSPAAASLGRFGDIPVNLNTGVADISVPLFTAKGKTLELPIALRYHASGLKVDDAGSWVGMGWALDAGGVITRTARYTLDERSNGYWNTGSTFYVGNNWSSPSSQLLLNIYYRVVDGEPDDFFYNFAGRSGKFVMGPTTSDPNLREVRTIPYQKWVIQPTIGTGGGGEITSWVITTEDGTKYSFTAQERITDWSPDASVDFYGSSKAYPQSWYLTQITAPSGDVITLTYAGYWAAHDMGLYQESFEDVASDNLYSACYSLPPLRSSATYYEINAQRLSSITTAQHTISFATSLRTDAIGPSDFPQTQYASTSGHPYLQEYKLDQITVSTRDPTPVVLRRFALSYDYSIGGRLTLTSVAEQDRNGISLPPYSFIYDPTPFPALGDWNLNNPQGNRYFSWSVATDHWGYYNGADNNGTYIPPGVSLLTGHQWPGNDRDPHPAFTKAGVLIKITYPTGGYDTLSYENNDYGWVGSTLTSEPARLASGLRIARVGMADAMGNLTVRKYFYTSGTYAGRSSGVVQAEPKYDYAVTGYDDGGYYCQYYSRSSVSRMPLGSGPVVGYTFVTVWDGPNAESGKTISTFTTTADPAMNPWPYGPWPYLRRTSYEWRRGQEDGSGEYTAADQMQHRVLNTYQFPEPTQTTRKFKGIAISVVGNGGGLTGLLTWNPFLVESGWRYRDTEMSTACDTTGGNCISTSKTFVYGNPNHTQLTELQETNSDGTQRITRMRYPADYAGGSGNPDAAAFTAMTDTANNIQNAVIERWIIKRVGSVDSVMTAALTTYRNFAVPPALPQFLPFQRFVLNSPSPLP